MKLSTSSSLGRSSFQFLTVFLIALVISVLYLSQNQARSGPRSTSLPPQYTTTTTTTQTDESTTRIAADDESGSNTDQEQLLQVNSTMPSPRCDVSSGEWVFDNQTYPLYEERECTFLFDHLACQKYGREDLSYQFWRWQPHHCDLPRFNGTALLERLRNKRLVYVGDSLNREQWVSMLCLVERSIHPSLKSFTINGSLSTFKAIEYNATIDFYWAPLLVESSSDHPILHRISDRIVRTQAIEKHARFWTDADYLIFDCYLWWKKPTMKILWGSFGSPDGIYKEIDMFKGYEMALRTWSDWLEIHVNHSKTQIFWMSLSPSHDRSEEWGGAEGLNCYNETQPIFKQDYWESEFDPYMMKIVKSEIDRLSRQGLNIQLLNISQLSRYRKDAHMSVHKKQWHNLTEEQLANPAKYADCYHWCLPGLPDTWNQILYAYIFHYF